MADNKELKLHKVKVDGLYGFADKDDNLVIPCQWKDAEEFTEELAAVKNKNNHWGFIDKAGSEVIQCKWFLAIPFKEGMARVIDESIRYGFIDKSGNEIVPCSWKFADDFFKGTAQVEDQSGNRFIIDKSGNIIKEYKKATGSENLVAEHTEDNNDAYNNSDTKEWYDIYSGGKIVFRDRYS